MNNPFSIERSSRLRAISLGAACGLMLASMGVPAQTPPSPPTASAPKPAVPSAPGLGVPAGRGAGVHGANSPFAPFSARDDVLP
ncbi:hypothetical protein [Polaromonas sp. CG_9.11]|uniref:hypothetical protein n=1 Tax=Polaromonas sp. CG_9.11 TaxID=2787730 RepID=UPI001A1BDC45|nr:hypothetical protein [Polaromonas sp. CG_9.11]